jgi:hypothetical protein
MGRPVKEVDIVVYLRCHDIKNMCEWLAATSKKEELGLEGRFEKARVFFEDILKDYKKKVGLDEKVG